MRELTRIEQLGWLKETLERELAGILEELEECYRELIGYTDMSEYDRNKVFDLATRLNQIEVERQKLDLEYNKIVNELWNMIPSLKSDPNLQPKVIKKGIKK